jgi:N-acetylmuramoyl-L-alanine amidase
MTVKHRFFGGDTVDVRGRVIDGRTLVEERHLYEFLGNYAIDWDAASATVLVWQRLTQITDDERVILEKIVQAEAGGEDLAGRRLVVNVILNRRKDKRYPDDIRGIVFQPNQFEPIRNGAYDRAVPSFETKLAVQEAFCIDDSMGALFFRAVKGNTPDSWHERSLRFLLEHGGHRFYAG